MTIHTDFRKGQRIRLMPKRSGDPHTVGKFVESLRDRIVLDVGGWNRTYKLSELRSVTIERSASTGSSHRE